MLFSLQPSATSSMVLQNRNLFPAFPLLSSMRKNSLCRSFKCFFWNIGGQLFYCIEFFTSIFLHKLASLTPQMSLLLTKLLNRPPVSKNFLCAYFGQSFFNCFSPSSLFSFFFLKRLGKHPENRCTASYRQF